MATGEGQNNNATSGASDSGGSATNNLLKVEEDSAVSNIHKSSYASGGQYLGATDSIGGSGYPIKGTDSLFNPFYIFRYAKYGSLDGKTYSAEYHKDLNTVFKTNEEGGVKSSLDIINDDKSKVTNPTAAQIVKWAADMAGGGNTTTLAPTTYQWNDFLWCKWYGKIPNNRMLTLRRYPVPVEDNLQVNEKVGPLIPLAQAVTWWGGDTDNSVSDILGMTYGFNWKKPLADDKIQNVSGNESSVEDLLNTVGAKNPNLRKILESLVFADMNNVYAGTGLDQKAQDWVKSSYTTGPYWNRVAGPINVIDTHEIRDRGYTFTHDIKLKFSYKTRAYSNINPKIAMLDLITNFLSLTHNKAEFWGGGLRYFTRTGYILPGLPSDKFEKGDFVGGIKDVINYVAVLGQGKSKEISQALGQLGTGELNDTKLADLANELGGSRAVQSIAGRNVSDLLKGPLSIRTFLDGRAVGEWHLTVGNPMNPFAVIGNLCLVSTTINFSESLGLDDFPTEVNFTVTLKPGRPRAKQDIESMFNLGGGDMSFTPLPQPASAFNSYGERNSKLLNKYKGKEGQDQATEPTQAVSNAAIETGVQDKNTNAKEVTPEEASNFAAYFRVNIQRAYGDKFAKSPAVTDYFINLKTKD
jgi:hypothetical protein